MQQTVDTGCAYREGGAERGSGPLGSQFAQGEMVPAGGKN